MHVLTAKAYERKAELGGGFRGTVYDRRTKTLIQSDVFTSRDDARNWAKREVFKIMGDKPWAPGYIWRPTWVMNVFAR